MSCPGLDPHEGFCRNCGRPVSMASGKPEHKRGRWREPLGLPRVKVALVIGHRGHELLQHLTKQRCPDCSAPLQQCGSSRLPRCPWTTAARSVVEDGLIRCDWPYAKERAV